MVGCTASSCPLGGHLAFTAQEHEALSMLHMACSMHLSQRALLRMPRRCTQRDLRTHNVSIIARTFLAKGYPVCWWKHCLFRKASSLDLLGPARAGVQTAMSSTQPTVNHGSTM